ncbi:MAG: DUF2244 domain-containing protein [Alphaproteobacteria bacterium]|nr:DUF2244 domain-containing protein [Alphaproteobacteria bacterium]MDE2109624.1 DUF2244 domain-containing protein [Alphaproteobacteria bacterium]MDE2493044.1 DUF2244 domain-containing protein [Alphaproteobacteria bacterium]
MDRDVLLDRVLRPSPPLKPRTLLVVLGFFALANLALSASFVLHGAWLILPFMATGVAMLGWAFRRTLIAAAREEHVTLTASSLRIERRKLDGRRQDIVLNPYWVRLEMDEPPEHDSQLILWSHGKGFRLGTFLAPSERASFAQALRSALWNARHGR